MKFYFFITGHIRDSLDNSFDINFYNSLIQSLGEQYDLTVAMHIWDQYNWSESYRKETARKKLVSKDDIQRLEDIFGPNIYLYDQNKLGKRKKASLFSQWSNRYICYRKHNYDKVDGVVMSCRFDLHNWRGFWAKDVSGQQLAGWIQNANTDQWNLISRHNRAMNSSDWFSITSTKNYAKVVNCVSKSFDTLFEESTNDRRQMGKSSKADAEHFTFYVMNTLQIDIHDLYWGYTIPAQGYYKKMYITRHSDITFEDSK